MNGPKGYSGLFRPTSFSTGRVALGPHPEHLGVHHLSGNGRRLDERNPPLYALRGWSIPLGRRVPAQVAGIVFRDKTKLGNCAAFVVAAELADRRSRSVSITADDTDTPVRLFRQCYDYFGPTPSTFSSSLRLELAAHRRGESGFSREWIAGVIATPLRVFRGKWLMVYCIVLAVNLFHFSFFFSFLFFKNIHGQTITRKRSLTSYKWTTEMGEFEPLKQNTDPDWILKRKPSTIKSIKSELYLTQRRCISVLSRVSQTNRIHTILFTFT